MLCTKEETHVHCSVKGFRTASGEGRHISPAVMKASKCLQVAGLARTSSSHSLPDPAVTDMML